MAAIATPPVVTVHAERPPARTLYPHAQWYFFAAMVTTWLGFGRSYFAVVRSAPLLNHLHGALMGGWIAILIVQPMLYQRGKLRLHRTLGRWAVYLWVPLLVAVGFLMDRHMLAAHSLPPFIIDQLAFLDLSSLVLFPVLIALSIVYGRTLQLHARYIVCTVLLLEPPALGRVLGIVPHLTFRGSVNLAYALMCLVLVLLIADDRRRGRIRAPYPAMLGLFGAMAVASNYARGWGWWHAVAGWVAST